MKVKSESEVAQSRRTHSNSMECSLPGSSVHGIFPGKSTGVGLPLPSPHVGYGESKEKDEESSLKKKIITIIKITQARAKIT